MRQVSCGVDRGVWPDKDCCIQEWNRRAPTVVGIDGTPCTEIMRVTFPNVPAIEQAPSSPRKAPEKMSLQEGAKRAQEIGADIERQRTEAYEREAAPEKERSDKRSGEDGDEGDEYGEARSLYEFIEIKGNHTAEKAIPEIITALKEAREDEAGRWKRSIAPLEAHYLKAHDTWGECKFESQLAEAREALINLRAEMARMIERNRKALAGQRRRADLATTEADKRLGALVEALILADRHGSFCDENESDDDHIEHMRLRKQIRKALAAYQAGK